jgi:hypothetical protein
VQKAARQINGAVAKPSEIRSRYRAATGVTPRKFKSQEDVASVQEFSLKELPTGDRLKLLPLFAFI